MLSKLLYMVLYFTFQQNVNSTCGYNLRNIYVYVKFTLVSSKAIKILFEKLTTRMPDWADKYFCDLDSII